MILAARGAQVDVGILKAGHELRGIVGHYQDLLIVRAFSKRETSTEASRKRLSKS